MSAFDPHLFDDDEDINPDLFEMALVAAKQAALAKSALIPPGGGAPAPDPAAMGGAPPAPGGAPPPDPSMGGAPPPPADPSLMGAPPPAPAPAQPGAVPGMPPKKSGNAEVLELLKAVKAELYQLRHLSVGIYKGMGLPIPDEAVLGPEPQAPPQDPNTAAASPAAAGAGALNAPGAAPGVAPPQPGQGIGGFPMTGPPGDVGGSAKAAAAALEAMLKESDDDDGHDDGEDFWRQFASRVPLSDMPPEKVGTVLPRQALGSLQGQPLLLALKARQASARYANA